MGQKINQDIVFIKLYSTYVSHDETGYSCICFILRRFLSARVFLLCRGALWGQSVHFSHQFEVARHLYWRGSGEDLAFGFMEEMSMLDANSTTAYSGFTGQFIDGKWIDGGAGEVLKVTNPYNDALLSEIVMADVADLNAAFAAAQKAQKEWQMTTPGHRASLFLRARAIMEARREEIVSWIIAESGSTRIKADFEFGAMFDGLLEASGAAHHVAGRILPVNAPGKEARVYRKPVGVVGVISPWNFPLHLSNRSVAPAIAVGNAVVLKPSSDTPVTGGLLLAKIYEEAGFPAGLLNVVIGKSSVIGDAFASHPVPRVISFTGSTAVGKHIASTSAASKNLKRLGLELGGNAPLVVLDDATFEAAVGAALIGRFMHQGQICMSTNRVIVDESLYGKFVDAYVEGARALKVGDPNSPDTMIGPLCNDAQVRSVLASIEMAKSEGFTAALRGDVQGRVVSPHVFSDVKNESAFAQSEIFGPIAPLICAAGEADALRIANDTEYGLSSAVFTENTTRGQRFALACEVGMTHINDLTIADYPHVMFGGEKNSGLGRFNGEWIIEEFTTDHLITVNI
jgi:aldehyde dehydrogenase (NAD+)